MHMPELRRTIVLLLAVSLFPAAGGCAASYITDILKEQEKTYNRKEATGYVHSPGMLQKVKKVVVPDFRVMFAASDLSKDEVYRDSPAEGIAYYPGDKFGVILAEFFEEELMKLSRMEVLERNRLKRILGEQDLQMGGLVEAPVVQGVNFEGADSMLLGTVTWGMYYMPNDPRVPSISMVGVHLRLIDIQTGKIILLYRDRQMMVRHFPDEAELYYRIARRFTAFLKRHM